jgi:putative tricarboxylic transport membrane protein
VRGLAALAIGLVLAMIGIDQPTGTARFSFGSRRCWTGIPIVVITVSLLALGEVLHQAAKAGGRGTRHSAAQRAALAVRAEFRAALPAWLRGTGTACRSASSRPAARRCPRSWPTAPSAGSTGGGRSRCSAAAPSRASPAREAAGNATAGTAMGALLALGLPTSATAALLLQPSSSTGCSRPAAAGAQRRHRLGAARRVLPRDGRAADPEPAVRALWAQLLRVPEVLPVRRHRGLRLVGVYAAGASTVDLVIMLVIGVLGWRCGSTTSRSRRC